MRCRSNADVEFDGTELDKERKTPNWQMAQAEAGFAAVLLTAHWTYILQHLNYTYRVQKVSLRL